VIARAFRKGLGAELVLARAFETTEQPRSFSGEAGPASAMPKPPVALSRSGKLAEPAGSGLASRRQLRAGTRPCPFCPWRNDGGMGGPGQGLVNTESSLVGCRTNFDHATAVPGAEFLILAGPESASPPHGRDCATPSGSSPAKPC